MPRGCFLGLILAIALGAAFWLAHARQDADGRSFAAALASAHVRETIVLSGKTYAIDGGAENPPGALRLAYEKVLAERAPLFSLAGTDPDALTSAAHDLAGLEKALAAYEQNPAKAQLVRFDLYPVDFLEAAAQTERARQAFIQSGSDRDALGYERAQEAALRAYETDLARFRDAFARAVPPETRSFTTAGLLISRSGMLSALDAMNTGTGKTRAALLARERCFAGVFAFCPPLTSPTINADSGVPALSPQNLTVAADVRSLLDSAKKEPGILTGPFLELAHSACLETSALPPLYVKYVIASWATGAPLDWVSYVGDVRLVETARFRGAPFEGFFAAQGVSYTENDPLAQYTCPYFGTDYGELYALSAARETALRAPLSALLLGPDARKLTALEASLTDDTLVRESDALRYASLARAIAESTTTTPEFAHKAEELALMSAYPSAGLVPAIERIIEFERRNMQAIQAHGVDVDLSAASLFYFRSAFPLLFMADNASVMPGTTKLFPAYTIPAEIDTPYVYYSTLPRSARAQVVLDLTRYFAFHRKTP